MTASEQFQQLQRGARLGPHRLLTHLAQALQARLAQAGVVVEFAGKTEEAATLAGTLAGTATPEQLAVVREALAELRNPAALSALLERG